MLEITVSMLLRLVAVVDIKRENEEFLSSSVSIDGGATPTQGEREFEVLWR
jgi:hypothetical protein